MFVSAIVAAGGHGSRLGGGELKQLRLVGGVAVLERSVNAFVAHPTISEVIVALPQYLVDDPPAYLRGHADAATPVRLVAGGDRRQDSVANAFRAAAPASELIVIHDAARPFVSADIITRTIEAAAESGAAVAALQARDTVKCADGPADRLRQGYGESRRSSRDCERAEADAGRHVRRARSIVANDRRGRATRGRHDRPTPRHRPTPPRQRM
jgi:2-C-methyl-D-erythritol 4-phosphate cytidylyltransferase